MTEEALPFARRRADIRAAAERLTTAERIALEARGHRDDAMAAAALAGMTGEAIARAAGLSSMQVSRILRHRIGAERHRVGADPGYYVPSGAAAAVDRAAEAERRREELAPPDDTRCRARTRSGRRCRGHIVRTGATLCSSHEDARARGAAVLPYVEE